MACKTRTHHRVIIWIQIWRLEIELKPMFTVSWLGIICPLTTLKLWSRDCAGDLVYPGTAISHWLLIVYAALEMVVGIIAVVFYSLGEI